MAMPAEYKPVTWKNMKNANHGRINVDVNFDPAKKGKDEKNTRRYKQMLHTETD